MTHLIYTVLPTGDSTRVRPGDIDPTEEAGIIDRTLLPVLHTGSGWADSRNSGYTVRGEIHANAASLQIFDEGAPVAVLAVALTSKTSRRMWSWLHLHAADPLVTSACPPPPWAALRNDVPLYLLPDWIDRWAQGVGIALLGREGW